MQPINTKDIILAITENGYLYIYQLITGFVISQFHYNVIILNAELQS